MIGALVLTLAALAAPLPPPDAAPLIERAYAAAYNLDYDAAIALARQAVAATPDDPKAHRSLASVLWLEIIFLRGTVTTDTYLAAMPAHAGVVSAATRGSRRGVPARDGSGDRPRRGVEQPRARQPGRAVRTRIGLRPSRELHRVGHRQHLGARSDRRAVRYDAEESVIDGDPSRISAAVVVGLYRYIVSTLALPSRWFAYVAGFGGGKAKGISMLESAVAGRGEGHLEAAVSLLLILRPRGPARRRRRARDAPRAGISAEPPLHARGRVGGRPRRSWPGGSTRSSRAGSRHSRPTPRPQFPGERALWLMKRGMARTEEGRLNDATRDLRAALAEASPAWIAGRSHLELGRIADLEGRRSDALAEYRQSRGLCTSAHDDPCVNDANRLSDKPFRGKQPADARPGVERFTTDRR